MSRLIAHLTHTAARWTYRLIIRWQNWRIARRVKRLRRKLQSIHTVQCPRCRHTVDDTPHGRNAHRQSCVRIPPPDQRGPGWGIRQTEKGPL